MASVKMSDVWKMRRMILGGCKVKDVANSVKVSESLVRQYTKSEREQMKIKATEAKNKATKVETVNITPKIVQIQVQSEVEQMDLFGQLIEA